MEVEKLKKFISGFKPNQKINIIFKSKIKETAAFRNESGGCSLGKITNVNTITNCDYDNLEYVQKRHADRDAAVAAGEAEPMRDRLAFETDLANTVQIYKDKYYILLYPRERWENAYKTFHIFSPDGEIDDTYESIDDIKDFITPSYFKAKQPDSEMPEIIKIPVENVYDITLQ